MNGDELTVTRTPKARKRPAALPDLAVPAIALDPPTPATETLPYIGDEAASGDADLDNDAIPQTPIEGTFSLVNEANNADKK